MKQAKAPLTISNADTAKFASLGALHGAMDGDHFAAQLVDFSEALHKAASLTDVRHIRAAYCEAYASAMGCTDKTAQNKWALLCNACGFTKPQSPEAIKKAAKRAVERESKSVNPKGAPEPDNAPDAPLDGSVAGAKIDAVLTSIEVHLIAMLRRGDFAKAAMLVNEMSKAAPF